MTEEKEYISLWDIKIPMEEGLKKKIWNIMKQIVEETLKDDEKLKEIIRIGIVRYKDFYVKLFKPVVENILDDMELKARIFWDDNDD